MHCTISGYVHFLRRRWFKRRGAGSTGDSTRVFVQIIFAQVHLTASRVSVVWALRRQGRVEKVHTRQSVSNVNAMHAYSGMFQSRMWTSPHVAGVYLWNWVNCDDSTAQGCDIGPSDNIESPQSIGGTGCHRAAVRTAEGRHLVWAGVPRLLMGGRKGSSICQPRNP
jgi:hypothetical protein